MAVNITEASGWDGFPRKRAGNLETAYNDGEFSDPRKWFGPREVALDLVFLDTDSAGQITHPEGAEGHLRTNVDTFLGKLYKRNGFLDLRKTVPTVGGGTHQRSLMCEVLDFFPIEESNKIIREATVVFRGVEGLWRQIETTGAEAPQKSVTVAGITGTSQAVNITTGGNAPVRGGLAAAFTIEFDVTTAITNPRLEVDATGEYVQYSGTVATGEVLLIDVGPKTAVINTTTRADAGLISGQAWMIDLDPASTTACTASSTAGNYDVTVRWYDRWI